MDRQFLLIFAFLTMNKNGIEYLKALANEFISNREQKLLELENSLNSGRLIKVKQLLEDINKYSALAETSLKLKKFFEEKE